MRFGKELIKIKSMFDLKKLYPFLLVVFILNSCKEKNKAESQTLNNEVVLDTSFAGARLHKFQKIEKGKYVGHIYPENEPVNSSPWFAFGLESEKTKQIELKLNYGNYQHRYVPKLSNDMINWEPLEASKIEIDTIRHTATLSLKVSSKKLFIAAQELEPSVKTYSWVDSLQSAIPELKKAVAGKTVLGNDNYVLLHENEKVTNSVVLVARQHPPEIPGGTIGFKSFFETVFSDSELAKTFRDSFNVYAFPLLNPDGADMGNWRHNAKGVDLNRDWVEFSQPETQMVKQFIEEKVRAGKKVRFAMDFHTSYSGPYLLVLDSINENKTDKIIPDWITEIEKTTNFKVEARRRSQELPYCYNYFYNELDSEAVTYEEGDEIDRTIIKRRAKAYAEELMKILLEKRFE